VAKGQRAWTEKENRFLVSAIKRGNSAGEIAKFLGRSEKSVQEHCRRLRIDVPALKAKKDVRSFSSVDVACPFFEKMYRGKSIRCEGLTPAGYITVGYEKEFMWKKHVECFCNKDYNKCPMYQLLYKIQLERKKRQKTDV
jgi:hypothetical protein